MVPSGDVWQLQAVISLNISIDHKVTKFCAVLTVPTLYTI